MTFQKIFDIIVWTIALAAFIFIYTVGVPQLINSDNDISVLFGLILIKVAIIGIIIGFSEYFYRKLPN